ncbi:MAG: putative co-chaperone Hsc20 [Myxococcaceae bacterium]|nr:putative co-chaperone Hsc20 [Myxococcaceae bacterium]
MDAFDVLGLTPLFDLDTKVIEQRYRDLQRTLHPDKFMQASASERRASLSRAVSVNEAYRVLRDELKRAEALFVRYGGQSGESANKTADPELLMEVMELREELASTKRGGEASASARARLGEDVQRKNQTATEQLRTAFAALSSSGASALDDAARALSRMRYYRRFLDEMASIEAESQDALD